MKIPLLNLLAKASARLSSFRHRSKSAVYPSSERLSARCDLVEPRLLFSADPVAPAFAAVAPEATPQVLSQSANPVSHSGATQSSNAVELIVIDERVQQQDLLLRDIEEQQANGRSMVVLHVSSRDDANQLLSNALGELHKNGTDVSAIHLISHGSEEGITLGQSEITAQSLRLNAVSTANWSVALTANADILIYGCDLGNSSKGQELISVLAALTGADVAGNNEATGAAALGGDWTLQYQTGSIETAVAISQAAQTKWQHILAAPTYQFAPTLANAFTSGNQATSATSDPASAATGGANRRVGVDAQGNFVVTWQDVDQNDAYFRVFNKNGTARTGDLLVASSSAGSGTQDSSVAMAADGTFALVWTNFNGINTTVFMQQFDANGGRIGSSDTAVSTAPSNTSVHASVAINASKTIVVTWEAFDRNTLGADYNAIYGRAFQWSGATALSADFKISSFDLLSTQSRPAVAVQGNRATVVWQSQSAGPFGYGIQARSFDIDGTNLSTTQYINGTTAGDQILPDVAVAANGNVFIAWQQNDTGTDSIHTRLLNSGLNSLSPERFITLGSGNNNSLPQIAASPSGDMYLVYQSLNEDGSGLGVFGAEIDSTGSISSSSYSFVGNTVAQLAGDQHSPNVAYTGGKAIFAWTGPSGSANDVFVRSAQITPPAIQVAASSLSTNEAGSSVTISVRLASQPTGSVTAVVQSSNNSETRLSGNTLIFDSSNWWIAQTVTLTGLPDGVVDGNQTYSINVTSYSSADLSYNVLQATPITLTNIDIDASLHEISVTTNSDIVDGDTRSLATLFAYQGTDGKVSLREAILAANNTVNDGTTPDAIYFQLAAASVITLSSNELIINDSVLIDGSRLSSTAANVSYDTVTHTPLFTLTGTAANASGFVLNPTSGGSTIQGLAIVGFTTYGLAVQSSSNTIQYNYIGISRDGSTAQANAQGGVLLENSSGNTVSNNVISGNGGKVLGSITYGSGIDVNNSSFNYITDNKIGTDATGSIAVGNVTQGIRFDGYGTAIASGNIVRGNTVSGNRGAGIRISGISADDNLIYGNWIGTNAAGIAAGNGSDGIAIQDGASGNAIGATATAPGNSIAFNTGSGVHVYGDSATAAVTLGNSILGNSIYKNRVLGIDLSGWDATNGVATGNERVNPNDLYDNDSGGNGLVNFPELLAAASDATTTRIKGTFSAAPNTFYRLEFFFSASANPIGYGEGETFLGYYNVATDTAGNASFIAPFNDPVSVGEYVSVTATKTTSTYAMAGNTSEFSRVIQVIAAPEFASGAGISPNENTITTFNAAQSPVLLSGSHPGLVFTLLSNADTSRFVIDSASGVVTNAYAPDFEALPLETFGGGDTLWVAKVGVSDELGYTAQIDIAYSVKDVNETPLINAPTGIASQEDATIAFTGAHSISINDPDAGTIDSSSPIKASVSVSEGTLSFGSLLGVTFSSSGAVWNLSGSLNDINASLQSMFYNPVANSSNTVVFSITVNDKGSGLGVGSAITSNAFFNITQTAVNDSPVVVLPSSYSVAYQGTLTLGNAGTAQLSDIDSGNLAVTLNVSVANGTLESGGLPPASSLTLTSTIANAQVFLNQLIYKPFASFSGNDTLTVSVNDLGNAGGGLAQTTSSAAIIAVAPNTAPVISGHPSSISFIENGAPLVIAPGLTITDIDSTLLLEAHIHILSGYNAASDSISLASPLPPGFTSFWESATTELKIVGTGTFNDFANILRTAQFECIGDAISASPRVITFHVFDGTSWSADAATQINVTAINDAPILNAPAQYMAPFAGTITLGTAAGSIITLSDPDSGAGIMSADVAVTNGQVSLSNLSGITIASGNPGGSNRLVFIGDIASIQSALNNINYTATPGFTGNDTLKISISDSGNSGAGGVLSAEQVLQINVQTSALPVVNQASNSLIYTENATPLLVWPQLDIAGAQGPTLNSATIAITTGYESGLDQLAANPSANIAVQWNAALGSLTFTGVATLAEYQSVLRSVTFANSSDSPSTLNRNVSLRVSDQFVSSAQSNLTLAVSAVNDSPVLNVPATIAGFEDIALSFNGAQSVNASDVDSQQLQLTIQLDKGKLAWKGSSAVPLGVTQISPLEFQLSGNAASINTWASQITVQGPTDYSGSIIVKWSLQDGGSLAALTERFTTIELAAVNDMPTFKNEQPVSVIQGQSLAITNANALASDPDNVASQLRYVIQTLPAQGALLLNGSALGVNASFTQDDIRNGLITYRHNGTFASADQFKFEVIDAAGASSGSQVLAISIQRAPLVIATPPSVTPTAAPTNPSSTASTSGTAATDIKALNVSSSAQSDSEVSSSAANVSAAPSAVAANANQKSSARASPSAVNAAGNDTTASEASINRQQTSSVQPTLNSGSSGDRTGLDKGTVATSQVANNREFNRNDLNASNSVFKLRGALESGAASDAVVGAITDKSFIQGVQKVREDVVSNKLAIDRNVVASSTAVSASLSIGYVIWLVRGGALLSSLLASLPAWQMVDPLPVLGSMGDRDDDESDDDSLGAMIDKSKATPNHTHTNTLINEHSSRAPSLNQPIEPAGISP